MTLLRLHLIAFTACLIGAELHAQSILFDFGNGDVDVNTGVAANFVVPDGSALGTLTNTQGGVELSITGVTTNSPGTYDSNSQGFGIVSTGDGGNAGAQRRIDTANDGETVQFSFDSDVILSSLRVGSLQTADEGFMLSFVSGVDPFSGGSFSYQTVDNGATEGPTFDIPLGDIPVAANTVLEFSTLVEGGGGILWNDINVFVGEPARPLTLQVLSNGELRLKGGTKGGSSPPPAIDIDAIQITSADVEDDGGSLNPAGFTGLGGDVAFPAGDGSGNGWELGLSLSDTFLAESFLLGDSSISNDAEVSLGLGYVPGGSEDITFTYREVGASTSTVGLVEYVTVDTGLAGDFNDDGVVDAVDYAVWRENLGAEESTINGAGDGSGVVDANDLGVWRANYGATAAASAAATPEPTGLVAAITAWLVHIGASGRRH